VGDEVVDVEEDEVVDVEDSLLSSESSLSSDEDSRIV